MVSPLQQRAILMNPEQDYCLRVIIFEKSSSKLIVINSKKNLNFRYLTLLKFTASFDLLLL